MANDLPDLTRHIRRIRSAGKATALGALLILLGAGFTSDMVVFAIAALCAPLLGWGLLGLLTVHADHRSPLLFTGFWLAIVGVVLLILGYTMAALGSAAGDEALAEQAMVLAIAPGFLIFVPFGLLLLGIPVWRLGILGSWRRFVPLIVAAVGVLAPQLLLLGFAAMGYILWDHARRLGPPPDTM